MIHAVRLEPMKACEKLRKQKKLDAEKLTIQAM